VILRRSQETAVPEDQVQRIVSTYHGSVIDHGDRTMLVDVEDDSAVENLRSELHGWVVSPQRSKVPVPDTRLKVRSQR
jgi:hypothetical protein